MITHHPDGDILLSYAAGALGESWSIGVASHLAFCEECRKSVDLLEELGGHVLDCSPVNPVPEFHGDLPVDVVNLDNKSNSFKRLKSVCFYFSLFITQELACAIELGCTNIFKSLSNNT